MTLIYKIVSEKTWRAAVANGRFEGATIDLNDGYIHFSTADQAEETARKHFAGQNDLMLVAIDPHHLGAALRWEVSRGGALFPHLFGILDPALVVWHKPLPWNGTTHDFPEGWRG